MLKKYKISEKLIDDIADNVFDSCPFDEQPITREAFRAICEEADATAIELSFKGQPLVIGAHRLHDTEHGKEFEAFCVFSVRNDQKLIHDFIIACEKLAKTLNCYSARFSTLRPAMVAVGKKHGYRISEVQMRKFL